MARYSGAELTDHLRGELARAPLPAGDAAQIAWASTVLRFTGEVTTVFDRPVLEAALAPRLLAERVAGEVFGSTGQRARVVDTGRRGTARFVVRFTERPAIVARVLELADRRGRPIEGLAPLVVGGSAPVRLAALRAALCVAGELSSPRRPVLTITCPTMTAAVAVRGLLRRADIPAKIRPATGSGVCRVDVTGDDVSHLLALVGATATSEQWRFAAQLLPQRGAPRVDGFDTANASRAAASAAVTTARVGRAFEILGDDVPAHLAVLGRLRQDHPDKSLDELGRLADPPISKDTIAGRLRRLLIVADTTARKAGVPDTYDAVPDELRTA